MAARRLHVRLLELRALAAPPGPARPASLRAMAGIAGGPSSKEGPQGGPESEGKTVQEMAQQAQEQMERAAQRAERDPQGTIKAAATGAKDAVKATAQFAKESVQAGAGYVREGAEKAMAQAGMATGMRKPRTDKEIDDQLEEEVRKGLAGHTPEHQGVSEVERDASAATTQPSQADPSLVRGDTIGGEPQKGSTSCEARVGGQPAGTVGKPPAM